MACEHARSVLAAERKRRSSDVAEEQQASSKQPRLEPTQSQARNDDAKSKGVPGASKSAGHAIGNSDDISGGDGSEDDDSGDDSGDDFLGGDDSGGDGSGDESVGRASAMKHETQWEVEAVLDHRVDSETGLGQFLVKWKHTWEPKGNLRHASHKVMEFRKKRGQFAGL